MASAYEMAGSACSGESLQECIVLTATPGTAKVNGVHDDPQCGVLSLTSSGAKAPAGKDCW